MTLPGESRARYGWHDYSPAADETGLCPRCGRWARLPLLEENAGVCGYCQLMDDYHPPGNWIESANCASTDPEVFFPQGYSKAGRSEERAKAICARCPVREECRKWARSNNEWFGVWGGESPYDRQPGAGVRYGLHPVEEEEAA